MKKIVILLFIIFSFFLASCKKSTSNDTNNASSGDSGNTLDPDPTPKKTTLLIFVDGKFAYEKEVLIGSKIDFELEDPDYLFLGWYDEDGITCLDGSTVTDSIVLYAKTIKYGTKFKITYHMDGDAYFVGVRYPQEYAFGSVTALQDPVRPLDYEFTGWYLNGELVTEIPSDIYGDIDLYDSWIDHNVYHTINYIAEGATSYSETPLTKVMEGVEYTFPYPIKEGYYFRGWYLEEEYTNRVYKMAEDNKQDYTLYAKFAVKTAADTYVSFVGDSISTYHGYIPADAGAYYPTFVNFPASSTYFLQVCQGMGYNFLKNDSYAGSRLTSAVYSDGIRIPPATDDARIAGLTDGVHDPDILIIHIGTNDYSQGVDKYNFKRCIFTYCKKVRALYDDVEIYFCLHPYNGYGDTYVKIREEFNRMIVEASAPEYNNYQYFDLTQIWGKSDYFNYIYSNAHPNEAGFKKMADFIIAELKKTHTFE